MKNSATAELKRLGTRDAGKSRAGVVVPCVEQVVEELVCNAVDARAHRVEVLLDLKRGVVEVEDDGEGMSPETLRQVGVHHVTSKMAPKDEADLLGCGATPLRPFGFKGEALFCLSHVGLVEVRSRVKTLLSKSPTFRMLLRDGEQVAFEREAGNRQTHGTTVSVFHLFHTMPVRRNLILEDQDATIQNVVRRIERLALARPQVKYRVTSQDTTDRVVLNFPGAQSTRHAFNLLFGGPHDLQDVNARTGCFEVHALVSRPCVEAMQLSSALQFIFVNGRPVPRVRRIEGLVNKLYRNFLETRGGGRKPLFPCFVLAIQCEAHLYDLLLDATKQRVEFRNWPALRHCLQKLFQNIIPDESLVPVEEDIKEEGSDLLMHILESDSSRDSSQSSTDNGLMHDSFSRFFLPSESLSQSSASSSSCECNILSTNDNVVDSWKQSTVKKRPRSSDDGLQHITGKRRSTENPGTALSANVLQHGHVISQVGAKFILLRYESQLLCIDQHAADERIRLEYFERDLIRDKTKSTILSTILLENAVPFSLPFFEASVLQRTKKGFMDWGFVFDEHLQEPCTFRLSQVPTVFSIPLGLGDLLETLEFVRGLPDGLSYMIPPPIRRRIVSRACKGAIKFGDELSYARCLRLVRELAECSFPFQCAHGRPTCCPLATIQKRNRVYM